VLQSDQRQDAAAESIERMVDWLQETRAKRPDDPVPQAERQRCRMELSTLLRSVGHEDRAKALERVSSSEATPTEARENRPRN